MAKCGDLGFTTTNGKPCGQSISSSNTTGCLWHSRTAAQRKLLATKGALLARKKRVLPSDYKMTPFTDRQAVVAFCEEMAKRVLTEDVLDPRRVEAALNAARVALSAFGQEVQERMVEALLRMEHGGTAFVMLERLTEGIAAGRRRPLPGAPLTLAAHTLGGDTQ